MIKKPQENDGWICPVWVCETEETQNNGESMHKKKESKRIEKAMHHPDKLGEGAKKRKSLPAKDKVKVVMKEFSKGTLHSGSGEKVSNPKQALAIGYSEARKRGSKIPRKK